MNKPLEVIDFSNHRRGSRVMFQPTHCRQRRKPIRRIEQLNLT